MTDNNTTDSLFFTNRDGNTLMKQFQGILEQNDSVKNFDAVVGFLRASGYFTHLWSRWDNEGYYRGFLEY